MLQFGQLPHRDRWTQIYSQHPSFLSDSLLTGRVEELIELLVEKNLVVLGLCETRMKENQDKVVHDKYRVLNSGQQDGRYGVGFLMKPGLGGLV